MIGSVRTELFKEALVKALENAPPVSKHIFKKKMIKRKIDMVGVLEFIKKHCPESHKLLLLDK